MRDKDGKPFVYPTFIHDSYDSSDAVNKFDWTKATDGKSISWKCQDRDYMKGLIVFVNLQMPSDSRVYKISKNVQPSLSKPKWCWKEDVIIGYQITAPNGDIYAVFVNADEKLAI